MYSLFCCFAYGIQDSANASQSPSPTFFLVSAIPFSKGTPERLEKEKFERLVTEFRQGQKNSNCHTVYRLIESGHYV